MDRATWLRKKATELDSLISTIEDQRSHERSFEHKATLVDLKKQRLAIKTELEELTE